MSPVGRPSSEILKAPARAAKPVVLCVDDDLAILSSLRRQLLNQPYEVVTAGSAAQALATLRRRPVSVIISDERMPEASGSELLAEVRERWPWVGRILLTAFQGEEVVTRSFDAGADFLLYKPWDGDSLKRMVLKLIEGAERARRRPDDGVVEGAGLDLGGEGG
jgi:response regulator RpfG family c-di-GMP phosphodiesterase